MISVTLPDMTPVRSRQQRKVAALLQGADCVEGGVWQRYDTHGSNRASNKQIQCPEKREITRLQQGAEVVEIECGGLPQHDVWNHERPVVANSHATLT